MWSAAAQLIGADRGNRFTLRGHYGQQAELIVVAAPGPQLATDDLQPPGQVMQAVTTRTGLRRLRYAVVDHLQRDHLVFLVRHDGAVPRRAVPQAVGDRLAEHYRQHGVDLIVKHSTLERD